MAPRWGHVMLLRLKSFRCSDFMVFYCCARFEDNWIISFWDITGTKMTQKETFDCCLKIMIITRLAFHMEILAILKLYCAHIDFDMSFSASNLTMIPLSKWKINVSNPKAHILSYNILKFWKKLRRNKRTTIQKRRKIWRH